MKKNNELINSVYIYSFKNKDELESSLEKDSLILFGGIY